MEDESRRMGYARTSREGISSKIYLADGSCHQLRNSRKAAVSTQGPAQPSLTAPGWRQQVVVDNTTIQHSLRIHDGPNWATVDVVSTRK